MKYFNKVFAFFLLKEKLRLPHRETGRELMIKVSVSGRRKLYWQKEVTLVKKSKDVSIWGRIYPTSKLTGETYVSILFKVKLAGNNALLA